MLTRSLARPVAAPCSSPLRPPARRPSVAACAAAAGDGGTGKYSTRLEHMDTVLLHPYHDLELAESELGAYCSNLTPEEQPEKCWQAYAFLERKHEAAKAGCDRQNEKDCAELAHLDEMAHELLATGSMDDLVATFATLARVEELREARAAKAGEATAAAAAAPAEVSPSAAAQQPPDAIHLLFGRFDRDGDGRLSVLEFRQGLDYALHQHLDGDTVALILDMFDVHDGFLTEDQFRDIVDAEQLVSHNQIVESWRRHSHERPGWWTAAPGGRYGSNLS